LDQKELRTEERGREMAKEERDRLFQSANAEKQVKTERVQQDIGGGYIVLEMSEDKKALFHDVLKGFEDYAKLKGYEIRFSVDTGQPEKIAFNFTIMSCGITVSTQQVSRDRAPGRLPNSCHLYPRNNPSFRSSCQKVR
jgi:hypothetical protein